MTDNPNTPEKQAVDIPDAGKEALESRIDQATPSSDQTTPPTKGSEQAELQNELGSRVYSPKVQAEAQINQAEPYAGSNKNEVPMPAERSAVATSGRDGNELDKPEIRADKGTKLDLPDQTFTDAKNREITIRAHNNGDNHMIRAYDQEQNPEAPESASLTKSVGQCNLTEEKVQYENQNTGELAYRTDRVRINDITVSDNYQSSGTGGRMIEEAEEIAQKTGARELYGDFTPEPGKEAELRSFYEKHQFNFRQVDGHTEVYKTFFFK